ncbi:hypothetical protein [Candidatus Hakubella thermalkaliphila]|uniref:hypothetical protein n=1 Tax=Candidatus Hakubella thermalkaliphila TaxID=2754717 RepID=UPI001592FBC3|nr:hypothetical protein [Candidatus Hakubella thermalkaliphila]
MARDGPEMKPPAAVGVRGKTFADKNLALPLDLHRTFLTATSATPVIKNTSSAS